MSNTFRRTRFKDKEEVKAKREVDRKKERIVLEEQMREEKEDNWIPDHVWEETKNNVRV